MWVCVSVFVLFKFGKWGKFAKINKIKNRRFVKNNNADGPEKRIWLSVYFYKWQSVFMICLKNQNKKHKID